MGVPIDEAENWDIEKGKCTMVGGSEILQQIKEGNSECTNEKDKSKLSIYMDRNVMELHGFSGECNAAKYIGIDLYGFDK